MEIPKEVKSVINRLKKQGFEAYIVGGCVRDFLTGVEPEDWDITTNAKPEQIQEVFPKSFYENKFLTVTVQTGSKKIKEIEITTYRAEAKYTDKRHPDEIRFAESIEEDLKRRDFTINAMAAAIERNNLKVIDHFNGQKDLKNKIIRAVGNPEERFKEDALRMLRAARLATVLNFKIEPKTAEAIAKNVSLLEAVSKERIREEFLKIIMADKADQGIELLRELGLLQYIIPELLEGYSVSQNKHHVYEVYEHNLLSLKYAAEKKFNKYVRIAALLHDIAKPKTKSGEGPDATFYNHEIVGAKITYKILNRLKFSKRDVEKITKLVRFHLFYYNVDEVGESSVRKLVRNTGIENMEELLQLRACDRIGSGCPKAEPYKLRHLKYLIEKTSQDPISVKMLKISGNDVMEILNIRPGPKIGWVLDVLLGEVLDKPENNKKEELKKKIKELGKLSDKGIQDLARKAKKEREKIEIKKDEMTKKKYWVT